MENRAQIIGHISSQSKEVTIVRDGKSVVLYPGDAVFMGDIIKIETSNVYMDLPNNQQIHLDVQPGFVMNDSFLKTIQIENTTAEDLENKDNDEDSNNDLSNEKVIHESLEADSTILRTAQEHIAESAIFDYPKKEGEENIINNSEVPLNDASVNPNINTGSTSIDTMTHDTALPPQINPSNITTPNVSNSATPTMIVNVPTGHIPAGTVIQTTIPPTTPGGQPIVITTVVPVNGGPVTIQLPQLPQGVTTPNIQLVTPNGHHTTPINAPTITVDTSIHAGDDTATATEDQVPAATHGNVLTNDDHDGTKVTTTGDIQGKYGTYHLQANGDYTYDLDNTKAQVQALAQGESVTDPVTYKIIDAAGNTTSATLTTTINGTNDKPIIQALTQLNVDEDSKANGQIGVSDVDKGDTLSVTTPAPIAGFTLHADGSYSIDTSNPAYQHLAKGDTLDLNIPIQVKDANGATDTSSLHIHITGTNDVPVIGGISQAIGSDKGAVGGIVHIDGGLSIVDVDDNESHFQAQLIQGKYGALSIAPDGQWHYSADAHQNALSSLNGSAHVDETFTVKSADGTTHDIHLKILGSDTPAIFGGVSAGMLKEDVTADFSAKMSVSDPDAGEAKFVALDQNTKYGHITLDETGQWHYHLDNTNPDVQKLAESQMLTDNVIVGSVDGTPNVIHINIVGTNDVPTVSSAVTLPGGNEDVVQTITAQQLLANATDVDATDTLSVKNISVDHGAVTVGANGDITFTPELNYNGKVTFTYDVVDSQGAKVQTTATTDLAAVQDAATITQTPIDVTEDTHTSATVTLGITDPDAGEAKFKAATITGSHGTATLSATGQLVYTLDNAAAQHLNANESITDTLTVTSADGTTKDVTVTIHGTNDNPVISAITAQSATEDGKTVTGTITSTDVDTGDSATYTTTATQAGFTLKADGSYTLDPTDASFQHLAAGETQTITIPVIATDTHSGTSAPQNLVITITGTNDIPVVSAPVTLPAGTEDLTQTITQAQLLANTTDVDTTDTLSVQNIKVDHGTVTTDASGTVHFTPESNYNGKVTFTYDVVDGHGGTVQTTATTNLAAVQDAATITQTPIDVTEDTHTSATITLGITDPDAGEAKFKAATITGAHGSATLSEAGQLVYTLDNKSAQHLK